MANLILPPNEIIKPDTISRRGFLRTMGVMTTMIEVSNFFIPEPRYVSGKSSKQYYYDGQMIKIQYDESRLLKLTGQIVDRLVKESQYVYKGNYVNVNSFPSRFLRSH